MLAWNFEPACCSVQRAVDKFFPAEGLIRQLVDMVQMASDTSVIEISSAKDKHENSKALGFHLTARLSYAGLITVEAD